MSLLFMTMGAFDAEQLEDPMLLRRMRNGAGTFGSVVVGLLTDEAVADITGEAPKHSYAERFATLGRCAWVDSIYQVRLGDYHHAITQIKPDVMVSRWVDDAESMWQRRYGVTDHWLTQDMQINLWVLPVAGEDFR